MSTNFPTMSELSILAVQSAGLELVLMSYLWQHRLHKFQRPRPLGQLGYIKSIAFVGRAISPLRINLGL